MTATEARQELEELVAVGNPATNSYKLRVRTLYEEVTGKQLRNCNCKDIYTDAIAEIYTKLKQPNARIMSNSRAKLVMGVVLQHNGNHYTNANITDKVAREFLAEFPQRKDWFATLPAEEKDSEANTPKAEVGEKPSKVEVGVVIPKKKAAKKGKK